MDDKELNRPGMTGEEVVKMLENLGLSRRQALRACRKAVKWLEWFEEEGKL